MRQRPDLSWTLLLPLMIVACAGVLYLSGCEKSRPVKIGEPAPEISAKDIYGRSVSLDRLKGKVVLVYFWTNSCCGNSLKELQPLYDRNRDKGLAVLAVNEIDARKDLESYAKTNAVTFTMLSDDGYRIFKRYQGMGFPTIFILDGNGVIREKVLGNIPAPKLEQLIERQLDNAKAAEASYEKLHRR